MTRTGAFPWLVWVTLILASFPWVGQLTHVRTGPVVHVVDGHTIDVQPNGRQVVVRYLGIKTLETKHPNMAVEPFGREAEATNRRLLSFA
jgi:endonuclease YncB( thermonuclease family)